MTMRRTQDLSYAMLCPDRLEAALRTPVAYVPWGALEWHSFHLPTGLDGLVAEAIAQRAAEHTGGIVLPPMYLPVTALPHRFSISFHATRRELCWTTCWNSSGALAFTSWWCSAGIMRRDTSWC